MKAVHGHSFINQIVRDTYQYIREEVLISAHTTIADYVSQQSITSRPTRNCTQKSLTLVDTAKDSNHSNHELSSPIMLMDM